MTSKEALDILENRNSKLHINHLIGSRRIADEEIKEIATLIDKLIKEGFTPLVERDTPKKVKIGTLGDFKFPICPNCNNELNEHYKDKFCKECGQRLDWSKSYIEIDEIEKENEAIENDK